MFAGTSDCHRNSGICGGSGEGSPFNTVSLVLDQCPGSRTSCRIDGVSSWYDFRLCRMETEIPNGQYCLRDSDCMSGVKRDCHHAKVSDSGSDGNGSFYLCVRRSAVWEIGTEYRKNGGIGI